MNPTAIIDRHWNALGSNGETFADTGYQNTWEVTIGQPGAAGILVNYTGGDYGATFGSGTPASRAQQFLTQIEPVLPGITPKWNGKAFNEPAFAGSFLFSSLRNKANYGKIIACIF